MPTSAPSITDRLWVYTNPEYDQALEPEDQAAGSVNPVRLNNDLIRLSNELLLFAGEKAALLAERTTLRFQKRKLKAARDARERSLMRDTPLSPAESKSLKTIDAAVARRAQLAGEDAQFEAWEVEESQLEKRLLHIEGQFEIYDTYAHTAEKMLDAIKSHLSYTKWDREAGRHAR